MPKQNEKKNVVALLSLPASNNSPLILAVESQKFQPEIRQNWFS